jgi:hypothetical protein
MECVEADRNNSNEDQTTSSWGLNEILCLNKVLDVVYLCGESDESIPIHETFHEPIFCTQACILDSNLM